MKEASIKHMHELREKSLAKACMVHLKVTHPT